MPQLIVSEAFQTPAGRYCLDYAEDIEVTAGKESSVPKTLPKGCPQFIVGPNAATECRSYS